MSYCGHELLIIADPVDLSSHEAATRSERVPCSLNTVHTDHWNQRLDFHWRSGEQGVYRVVPVGAVTMEDPDIETKVYKDVYRSSLKAW